MVKEYVDFHIEELGDDYLEKIGISNPSTDYGQNRSSRSFGPSKLGKLKYRAKSNMFIFC